MLDSVSRLSVPLCNLVQLIHTNISNMMSENHQKS